MAKDKNKNKRDVHYFTGDSGEVQDVAYDSDEIIDEDILDDAEVEPAEEPKKNVVQYQNSSELLKNRLSKITGKTTEINRDINSEIDSNSQLIEELYKKAETNFQEFKSTKQTGLFGFLGKSKAETKLKTAQESIEELFEAIEAELQNTEQVGMRFQEMARTLQEEQIPELEELLKLSDSEMEQFKDSSMIPFDILRTNSHIKAELERLQGRLLKLQSGITITQGTVIDLASRLPAVKAGIEDETAFGIELSKMTDVYSRVQNASQILLNLSDHNAEVIHNKVEEVLDAQLSDDTMINHVRSKAQQSNNLAEMVQDRSMRLSDKFKSESKEIAAIRQNSKAIGTAKNLKKLNA